MRPAIATSPRIIRNSSIWVTLRSLVHPVEAHGTTLVSGMSRELQRAGAAEQLEDVAPEAVVVADPRVRTLVTAARPTARQVEAKVAHRPHQRVVLEQRAVPLQRLSEVVRPIGRAEAAPGDEIGAGRDRRRRVDL